MPSATVTPLNEAQGERAVEVRFAKEVAVAKILARQYFNGLSNTESNTRARKMDWPRYWSASQFNWIAAARGVLHLVSDPDPLATGVDAQNVEENVQYWEIYVPALDNDGGVYAVAHHLAWDRHVVALVGGLTLVKPVQGRWRDATTEVKEKMIPVRIICTRSQMVDIIEFTRMYYSQKVVMAYVVSNEVLIR
jgi:hypothetical protein